MKSLNALDWTLVLGRDFYSEFFGSFVTQMEAT